MCGACCKGSVELTSEEFDRIRQIGKNMGIRVPIEIRDYIFTTKIIMKPIEDSEGERWCIFLRREGSRAICTIYENRPTFCRLYPLYIGYSIENNTIYVDIVHCPNMKHRKHEEYIELNNEEVSKIIEDVIKQNPDILNIVPNLDRPSILFDLGDRLVIAKLYKKYEILKSINSKLINSISRRENIINMIEDLLKIESSIRDISVKIMREGIREYSNPNTIVSEVLEYKDRYSFNKDSIVQNMNIMLKDMGILIEENMYMVHDMVSLKSKLVKISLEDIINVYLKDLEIYIREIFDRFPVFNQLYYLPLEIYYTHGIIPVISLLCIYYLALRSYRNFDEICACVDMGGLPYVFKYVSTLVRLSYSSYPHDVWNFSIEV